MFGPSRSRPQPSLPPNDIDLSMMVYLLKPPDSFLVFKTSNQPTVQELKKHRWASKRLFWDNEIAEHVTESCIVEWEDGVVTVEHKVVQGEERATLLREKLHEETGTEDPDLHFVGVVKGREMHVTKRVLIAGDADRDRRYDEDVRLLRDGDEYDDDAWLLD